MVIITTVHTNNNDPKEPEIYFPQLVSAWPCLSFKTPDLSKMNILMSNIKPIAKAETARGLLKLMMNDLAKQTLYR